MLYDHGLYYGYKYYEYFTSIPLPFDAAIDEVIDKIYDDDPRLLVMIENLSVDEKDFEEKAQIFEQGIKDAIRNAVEGGELLL